MGEVAFDRDEPFSASGWRAAAVLCRTPHGNLHAGVLHRAAAGTTAVLHLGWQDALDLDGPWAPLGATPEVAPEKLMAAAGHCRRIWRVFQASKKFPYALASAVAASTARGASFLARTPKG